MTDFPSSGEFAGKVALVTGGSRGIGRAIVLAFAGLGCQVIIRYRSDRAAAAAVRQEAVGRGWQVTVAQADVGFSDRPSVWWTACLLNTAASISW